MKTVFLVLLLAISCLADEANDRGANAAQVASAGIAAARNGQRPGFNSVPYLTSNSYMSQAFIIIGGILYNYINVQMQPQFKSALTDLNTRIDQLESDINTNRLYLAYLINKQQLATDVTNPTTILWGEIQAYVQHPTNSTYGNIQFDCARQTAWQIATKLQLDLYGPDGSLTNIQSGAYSNDSVMATKDVIMFRIFKLMMVQSFCLGVEHGPNYKIAGDWEFSRMYNIYTTLANETENLRIRQEANYLESAATGIFNDCVTGSSKGSYGSYANCIFSDLLNRYPWDHFGVILGDWNCVNDHIGTYQRLPYKGSYAGGQGYQPYSVWQHGSGKVYVFIIRYWAPNDFGSRTSQYTGCMKDAYDTNPVKWAGYINCGQSFDILSDDWFCGKDTVYYGYNSNYFVSGVKYTKTAQSTGTSSAVYPYPQRPTTVAYDLGFWERPIPIQLLPIPN